MNIPLKKFNLNNYLNEIEFRMIKEALITSKGNIAKAASILGLGRTTLHMKMKKHGIEKTFDFINDDVKAKA